METILGRFRNLIVLAAILFAQIVGLAVQVKRPAQQGDTRLIRVWAVSAITPLEKAVSQHAELRSTTRGTTTRICVACGVRIASSAPSWIA